MLDSRKLAHVFSCIFDSPELGHPAEDISLLLHEKGEMARAAKNQRCRSEKWMRQTRTRMERESAIMDHIRRRDYASSWKELIKNQYSYAGWAMLRDSRPGVCLIHAT